MTVLAFVLAILGQTLLCGMLLGFVIVIQKDEWLTKQVMQAFFLALVESIISCVTNIFSGLYAIPILGIAFSGNRWSYQRHSLFSFVNHWTYRNRESIKRLRCKNSHSI